ncbi:MULTISPECIES: hypothetical protein [unclassified Saccharicrinis]|uniref:hypothetical protein n=1 Tax=unclassified Saccharicrinis TaxID=2646859 RepID=UPI003D343E47
MSVEIPKRKLQHINVRIITALALLELLYLLNRDFLRPSYKSNEIIVVFLGSLPNFLAALGASMAIIPVGLKWLDNKMSRMVVYIFSMGCLGLLVQEEITPFAFGSCVNDVNDMIASSIGTVMGISLYELLRSCRLDRNHNHEVVKYE